jgi:hypothetical protein
MTAVRIQIQPTINPTGKSLARFFDPSVNPQIKKYSDFQNTRLTLYSPHPVPQKGRYAIVTFAGRAAVDAEGATDERA